MPSGVYKRLDTESLFWTKVKKTDTCWLWLAGSCGSYGQFAVKRQSVNAHVYSYVLHHGPVPHGCVVRHTCDVPKCVNPEHLIVGTQKDNIQDAVMRGRPCSGSKHGMSVLNEEKAAKAKLLLHTKSYREVAELLKVGRHLIYDIKRGRTWRHV